MEEKAKQKGWICLHRKIQDCFLWDSNEKFDVRSAWIDLLLLANHEDKKTMFKGNPIVVKRGQRITSVRILADRWHWSNDKTLKYLRMLEAENMIIKESDNFRTLLTIVNYELYQDKENTKQNTKRTQTERRPNADRTQTEHKPVTNNNENNENNENNDKQIKKEVVADEIFLTLPLADGSSHPVTKSDLMEYRELFPTLDVEQELRNMKAWCNGNPANRKTVKGVKRFINGWLMRDANDPRKAQRPVAKKTTEPPKVEEPELTDEEWIAAMEAQYGKQE